MKLRQDMQCPKCSGKDFTAKYESTYVYSYTIDMNDDEADNLPFLFDNRQKKDSKQYIECNGCKAQYPCEFTMGSEHMDFTILQKAVRGNYVDDVEFWG